MKNILFTLCLFCCLVTSAQKIHFTDRSNQWVSTVTGVDLCPFHYTLSYGADAVISGTNYAHLQGAIAYDFISGCLPYNFFADYYVREDTAAGLVYYRNMNGGLPSDTNEHVFFNYNLHAGDTVNFGGATTDSVLAVDSTLINGTYHRIFAMCPRNTLSTPFTFVEGIGSMEYPYVNFSDGCFEFAQRLVCFSQGGGYPAIDFLKRECPFDDSFHNAISCKKLEIRNDNTILAAINVSPNPANDRIDITLSNEPSAGVVITIYDLTGRTMACKKAQTGSVSFSTVNWGNGIYIVTVIQNGAAVKRERIVVTH